MTHEYAVFLWTVAARTLIVLLWLVVGLRVLGKRQLGQMNVYDLVMIMCLSNAVQNALTYGKGELSVGLVSAGMLLLAGRVMSELFVRAPGLEKRLVGTPTVVISEGRLVWENLRREHLTEDEVLAALREHGLGDPKEVKMAILEVDGSLSVVPSDGESSSSSSSALHQ